MAYSSRLSCLDIGLKILPRFFLVAGLSGVKGMSFSFDGVTERAIAATPNSPAYAAVECKNASWTWKYHSGYTVTLRGPLTAEIQLQYPGIPGQTRYQIKCFIFDASTHEQQILLEAIDGVRRIGDAPSVGKPFYDDSRILFENASIPPEPINAFGIPQVTMRCLEVRRVVNHLTMNVYGVFSLRRAVSS